jgi:hypothetical protein
MIFAVLCGLTGIALGQRFKLMALVPAGGLVLGLAWAIAAAGSLVTMMLVAVDGIASLQIGYLLGVGIRYLLTDGRTPITGSTTTRRPAL